MILKVSRLKLNPKRGKSLWNRKSNITGRDTKSSFENAWNISYWSFRYHCNSAAAIYEIIKISDYVLLVWSFISILILALPNSAARRYWTFSIPANSQPHDPIAQNNAVFHPVFHTVSAVSFGRECVRSVWSDLAYSNLSLDLLVF